MKFSLSLLLVIAPVSSAYSFEGILEVMWGNVLYGGHSSSQRSNYVKQTAKATPAERNQLQFYWAKMNMLGWSSKKLNLNCSNTNELNLFLSGATRFKKQPSSKVSSFALAQLMFDSAPTKIRTTPGSENSFEVTLDDNSFDHGEKIIKTCRFYTSFHAPIDPEVEEAVREGNGVMDHGSHYYHKKIISVPTITKVDCGIRYPEKIYPLSAWYHSVSKCSLTADAQVKLDEWFKSPEKNQVNDSDRSIDQKNSLPESDNIFRPKNKNLPIRPEVSDEGVMPI